MQLGWYRARCDFQKEKNEWIFVDTSESLPDVSSEEIGAAFASLASNSNTDSFSMVGSGREVQLRLEEGSTEDLSTYVQPTPNHTKRTPPPPSSKHLNTTAMDPFSSEGGRLAHSMLVPPLLGLTALTRLLIELLNLHNSFHQGQYSAVVSENTSTLSPENQTAAKVYILRARIQSGEADTVAQELGDASEPDLQAVKAFAEYTAGSEDSAIAAIDELVASSSDNGTVQVLGATVLHLAGRSDDALGLLSKHQGNLEA
jgi:hypothetical protein